MAMQMNELDKEVLENLRKAGDIGSWRQALFNQSECALEAQKISESLNKLKRYRLIRRGDERGANGFTWYFVREQPFQSTRPGRARLRR